MEKFLRVKRERDEYEKKQEEDLLAGIDVEGEYVDSETGWFPYKDKEGNLVSDESKLDNTSKKLEILATEGDDEQLPDEDDD